MKASLFVLAVVLLPVLVSGPIRGQGKRSQPIVTFLTADACVKPIGGNVSSLLREKIRGSSGYALADTPSSEDAGAGPEILLMCTDVPHEPMTAVAYFISYKNGRTPEIGISWC